LAWTESTSKLVINAMEIHAEIPAAAERKGKEKEKKR
jgi:hypothetical protein